MYLEAVRSQGGTGGCWLSTTASWPPNWDGSVIPGLKIHPSLAHSLSYLTSYLCVLGHLIALKFCLRVCFWGDANQDTRKR